MNQFWTTIIFNAVRSIVGSGMFDDVAAMVKDLIETDIPGNEKKQQVKDYLLRKKASLPNVLLDSLIFAVRLRYER